MWIDIPAALLVCSTTIFNWNFEMEAERAGRTAHPCRAAHAGGSSSINGMLYVRASRSTTNLGQLGNRGWSYSQVLPYFRSRRISSAAATTAAARAARSMSPNCATLPSCATPSSMPRRQAATEEQGLNNGDQEGFGYYQVTMKNGNANRRRAPSSIRFAIVRISGSNRCVGRKVILEGKRAAGVAYSGTPSARGAGQIARSSCRAARAVAGVLEHSGIASRTAAPAWHRGEARAEGVGENYGDHSRRA